MLRRLLLLLAPLVPAVAVAYTPEAHPVADGVYAIVGPLGQRSAENDGLNANYGAIVTPGGTILIDSGASRLGAERMVMLRWRLTLWSLPEGRPQMSNFYCLPGRAGGFPVIG